MKHWNDLMMALEKTNPLPSGEQKLYRIIDNGEIKAGDIVVRRGKRFVVESFCYRRGQFWINTYSMCERKYFVRMTPEEVGCAVRVEVQANH